MYCTTTRLHKLFECASHWQDVPKETWEYPSWFDEHTRGCTHPDGVILAGSSKEGDENKVIFLDMHHNNVVKLPVLEHNLKNVGMVFDNDTGRLIIAGGKTPDGNLSKLVWKLPQLDKDAEWEELTALQEPVANPMLVNDKEYLYVLGGEDCTKCVRRCKDPKDEEEKKWKNLEDLPRTLVTIEYSNGLHSGALVCDGKVTVFTRTKFLALEVDRQDPTKKTWIDNAYGDDPKMKAKHKITRLTPILHGDEIAAGIQRDSAKRNTVEILETDSKGIKYWKEKKKGFETGEIGAGRFISVLMDVDEAIGIS